MAYRALDAQSGRSRSRRSSTAARRARAPHASTNAGVAIAKRGSGAVNPLIGGLLLAIGGAPAHETAWATGGSGEQSVGRGLERRTANGPAILLHDRRMPGGYGNIDHLAIAPRGC